MALELRDRLGAKLELSLPTTLVVRPPDRRSARRRHAPTGRRAATNRAPPRRLPTSAGAVDPTELPRAIEDLSDDELVTLVRSL